MDLFKLINKNGQIQISMVQFLLDHNGQAEQSDILKQLGLSKFIFESNIQELSTRLDTLNIGLSVSFNRKEDRIYLKKNNTTNLDRLYYHLLSESPEYQLLVYLYYHPEYSVAKLATHLAMGEAAVYRHISKLNKLISDFEISIKRGQITGSELQICYFFYRLFWNALPLEELNERAKDQNTWQFINYLEKRLKQRFNDTAKLKLYLWIQILKTRVNAHDENTQVTDPILSYFLKNQIEDPLYLTIREGYFLSMSHFAIFGSDYKTVYLYFFISSVFILDSNNPFFAETAGYWPTFNGKIAQLNDIVVKKVKETYHLTIEMVDELFIVEWKYILTQIHSLIFYFKGSVSFFDDQILYERLLTGNIYTPDLSLVSEIINEIEHARKKMLIPADRQLLSRIYLFFINEMRRFSRKIISIGVSYHRDYLQNQLITQTIKLEFEARYPLICEVAQPGTHYDLLIADSAVFTKNYDYNHLYIINDFKTSSDTTALTALIKEFLTKEGPI